MPENDHRAQIILRPMTFDDLNRVAAIDRASFPTPWPREAFRYELQRNRGSVCWVAETDSGDGGRIVVASIVIWLVGKNAHIGTLAVKPDHREKGIAQQLVARTLLICSVRGAQQATLEVRTSNTAAQQLYRKFGFESIGIKPDYYKDTHEDALVMRLASLDEEKLADLAQHG